MIRAATILQLLLGNIGRPGGGILALRGHASIQGSTDIPTLYNLLPGYLNTPSALKNARHPGRLHRDRDQPDELLGQLPQVHRQPAQGLVRRGGDEGERLRLRLAAPRTSATTRTCRCSSRWPRGRSRASWRWARTRPSAARTPAIQRQALAKLDWLVVRDLYETETATLLEGQPRGRIGRAEARGDRHRGLPPPGRRDRRDGRHLHQHPAPAPVARPRRRPARRRPVRPLVHRPPRPAAQGALRRRARSTRDRPIQALTWDYIDPEENAGWQVKDEPSATPGPQGDQRLLRRRRASRSRASATSRPTARRPAAPGSTAASTPRRPRSPTATTTPPTARATTGWPSAGASPGRPTAGSCTTAPRPTRRATPGPRRPGWPAQHGKGPRATSTGTPRREAPTRPIPAKIVTRPLGRPRRPRLPASPSRRPPRPSPTASGLDFHDGASPFIMKADGKGWLFAPSGLVDGPLADALRAVRVAGARTWSIPSSRATRWPRSSTSPGNPYAPAGSAEYPVRPLDLPADRAPPERLDEPLAPLAGRASARAVRRAQPRARRGDRRGEPRRAWRSPRPAATIHAKALVTRRIRPFLIDGQDRPPRRHALALGLQGGRHGRRGQRPLGPGRRPERDDPRGQGVRLPGRKGRSTAAAAVQNGGQRAELTHGRSRRVLHRHDRLHRLQGVRGGLPPVERPAGPGRRARPADAATATTTPCASPTSTGGTSSSSSSSAPTARRRAG